MKELGIYLHIPFCKQKCEYCDFISFTNHDEIIENYIEKLKEEINIETIPEEYEVTSIYIGGGTPSYIESRYITDVIKTIKTKFKIKTLEKIEITLEVNPGTVNEKKMQEYINSGINRISIGMQETNNMILKTIGRIHTYEEFIKTYKLSKKIGFKNINVDIMIGLPNQTLLNVKNTLTNIIDLNPEHISMYSLILEEGTPLEEKIKNKEIKLPKEEIERKMYWNAKKMLEKEGYIHYEISNFAKEGYESKHNLNCWNQKEYIGFGVAAHSYLNGKRYSNTNNIKKYINYIGKAKETYQIINETQTKEEEMQEYMLLGLRKINGIKISEFKNKFVDNPIYEYKESLNKLVEKKLIIIDADEIKLTKKGIDLANLVWEEFV